MKKFLSLAILGFFVISFIGESSAMQMDWTKFPGGERIVWAPRANPQKEMELAAQWRAELERKEANGTITNEEKYELMDMQLLDNDEPLEANPPLEIDF